MSKKKIEADLTGGELTDVPNDQYKKFFDKFNEIESLSIENWKPVHLLGYFCKKYQEAYGTKYQFKFNSLSPIKCFEVFQIKKLAMQLTSNPTLLKEYIDWIYLNKVIKAKRKLTSISFMTNDSVVNEYKFNVLLAGKRNLNVDRSTPLPDKYKVLFAEAGVTITTYGDLAFVSQMSNMSPELILVFSKIEEIGFDKDILGRIV